MIKLNLHIYPSPFKFESRILRETNSVIERKLADRVIIASGWSEGLSEYEKVNDRISVKRFRLLSDRLGKTGLLYPLRYIEFLLRVLLYFTGKKIHTVNCHSLLVLPVGYLLKLTRSSIWLIYDAHELEGLKTGLGKTGQKFCLSLESLLIRKVDRLIVVSPSIENWYKSTYGLDTTVLVRNVPHLNRDIKRVSVLNDRFGIPANHLVFIYQGLISKGRGIELLLECFREMDASKHIVFMGYGPLSPMVIEAQELHANIHFLDAVPPGEIVKFTSGADVGLSLIENASLSYYYCLPNKFFEYLQCGVPVIASNFPDMAQVIDSYECGWKVPPSASALKELIRNIDKSDVTKKAECATRAHAYFNWNNESVRLDAAYPGSDR